MSFSIKCNKCGVVVEELRYCDEDYSDNQTFSDEERTITVKSIAGWHGTSEISIVCKCGNEE